MNLNFRGCCCWNAPDELSEAMESHDERAGGLRVRGRNTAGMESTLRLLFDKSYAEHRAGRAPLIDLFTTARSLLGEGQLGKDE
jgi:hypothetical protein